MNILKNHFIDNSSPDYVRALFEQYKKRDDYNSEILSSDSLCLPDGILCERLETYDDLFNRFASLESDDDIILTSHFSHLSSVIRLTIPENYQSDKPIIIKHDILKTLCDHIVIQAGAGSKVCVVEDITYHAKENSQFGFERNGFVEIFLASDVNIQYIVFEDVAPQARYYTQRRAYLEDRAHLQYWQAAFGGAYHKTSMIATLSGEHATSDLSLVSLSQADEHIDTYFENNFQFPRSKGHIRTHHIARGRSLTESIGMIRIGRPGQGTDCKMKQQSFILDDTAHVHVVPSLEIDTNDVKAGHGSTVTRIPMESLLYLQSRGIDRDQAEKMIIEGVLYELFPESVSDINIFQRLSQCLYSFYVSS